MESGTPRFFMTSRTCSVSDHCSTNNHPDEQEDAYIELEHLHSWMVSQEDEAFAALWERMTEEVFFDQGKVIWTRGYGVADVQTGRPVTPETLFQAGSISKPIAALGALRLVEQGKLKLDANVNDELRSWKVPDNEFTVEQKVTLRRILSHSAGTTVHGYSGYNPGDPLPTTVQILEGAKPANSPAVRVDTVPGTVYRYSGGGMMILQLMMM